MSPTLLDSPTFRSYLGERILCHVTTEEKRLALTFDDGPHPRHTTELLDLLAAKKIPATFFVVGRRVRRFFEIVERAASEGHEIGNHGDLHLPLPMLPAPLIRREITVTDEHIASITGERPRFLRPPMGWINERVLGIARRMGYFAVIGNIHPRDSRQPGTSSIVEYVLDRAGPGAIIILHDGGWRVTADRSQTIAAVDRITDDLAAQGYRFDTLSGLVQRTGGLALCP